MRRPAESQHDVAGRLGAARVIEGAAVKPDPLALPAEVAHGHGTAAPDLPIAEAQQGSVEIDALPVEPGIENGRRRHHAGGNAKQPALESRPDDPVEMDRVARGAEARDEARAQQGEGGDCEGSAASELRRDSNSRRRASALPALLLVRFPAANPIPPG